MSTMYRPVYQPATREIRDTFGDEITLLGGSMSDVFDDGQQLFAWAVLDADTDIRPGDSVCAGIVVRATASEIRVCPYTLREVCTNGAIVAHALQSRRLERTESTEVFLPTYEIAVTLADLRDAVCACASGEVFAAAADEMRSTSEVEADMALHLLPALARLPRHMAASILPQILRRFSADGDRSAFGLLNAVTSVARDTHDPETRWNLEELGGTMPARIARQLRAAGAVPYFAVT